MPDNTYTTYAIAKICDVYPSSVINWINDGKLKAYMTPGGHHRVTRDNLLEFLKEFKMPIPRELTATGRRVLIVDDEVEVTRVLEKAFQGLPGAEIETCHDGVDALIRIGQQMPDLVVLDIVLPKMDGFEVCKILKSKPETRGIKIIGVSGKTEPEKDPARYKIDAFFQKPLDIEQLIASAEALLGAGEPADARRRAEG